MVHWISRACAYGLILFFVLGNAQHCSGETDRVWRKRWILTVVALTATNVFDACSSRGRYETNPLLRGAQGQFSARRGVVIKSAASGGALAMQAILIKKTPKGHLYKPFAIANAAAAGVTVGTALHNYGLDRPKPPR